LAQRGRRGARRSRSTQSISAKRTGQPRRTGEMAGRFAQSIDGAGDDESLLAALLRPWLGGDGERFRHARDAADTPGIARLAGDRVHGPGLEHESDAPPDRDLGDVSAIVAA